MRKSSEKAKKTELARLGGGPEGPSGRFWTQWIEPWGVALLSQTLGPVYFVVKNRGPNDIWLAAQCSDLMDVRAGDVRATYAYGTITVLARAATYRSIVAVPLLHEKNPADGSDFRSLRGHQRIGLSRWRFRHDGAYRKQYRRGANPLRDRSATWSQSRLA